MPTLAEKEAEFIRGFSAISHLADYITFIFPAYARSRFSDSVCAALDQFILDIEAGKRPILVLQSPPQTGKSEIVSRKLPAYLLGKHPEWRIGAASYSDELANSMAQDVRRVLASPEHRWLFPTPEAKERFAVSRIGEFTAPGGTGSYLAVGIGAGLTGRSLTVGVIDDPTRDAKDALSDTVKESHWNWYQSVFTTRLGEHSGQIIMATSWAQDDLPARILEQFHGDARLTHLRFPAINSPEESGYNPDLPLGPLCPEFRSLEFLLQQKALCSEYWWSALYQQSPRPLGGNVFKSTGVQHYAPWDIPKRFDKVIASWDCTFRDTDGTDFVVGTVWGKSGANSYLLDMARARMSFTETLRNVVELKNRWPATREILVEAKANGDAVIDTLKTQVPGLIPVEPDGGKLARAHSVTFAWEAKNVWLPYPQTTPWMREFLSEVLNFPAAAHDDIVDSMSQALRHLYPLSGRLKITQAAIDKAMGRL